MEDHAKVMRVLMTVWDFPASESGAVVGGMIKNPFYLVRELRSRGLTVDVVTTTREPSASPRMQRLGPSHLYVAPPTGKGVVRNVNRIRALSRAVEAQGRRYDVVHCHMPSLYVRARARAGAPLILTAHGTHWPELRANHSAVEPRNWPIYANAIVQREIEGALYRSADAVISVSTFQTEELSRIYGVSKERIATINNGIDPHRYKSAVSRAGDSNPTSRFLFVGRPVPKKGLLALLAAFEIVADKEPGVSITFVCGGGWVSEPNLLSLLQHRIAHSRHAPAIRVIPDCPESEMPAVYRQHDLLVVPSTGYESLPTVILEAGFSGLGVLASDAFGNREVLGVESLVTNPEDVDLLAARMLDACRVGAGSLRPSADSLERYTIQAVADRHMELYENLRR
jgi:glycosyltransferase involved in cell wall biosynthesis